MRADPRRPGYLRIVWYTHPKPVSRPPLGAMTTLQAWENAAQESLERSLARRRPKRKRRWRLLGFIAVVIVIAIVLSLLGLVKSWA